MGRCGGMAPAPSGGALGMGVSPQFVQVNPPL
jgi:hypothetical protein